MYIKGKIRVIKTYLGNRSEIFGSLQSSSEIFGKFRRADEKCSSSPGCTLKEHDSVHKYNVGSNYIVLQSIKIRMARMVSNNLHAIHITSCCIKITSINPACTELTIFLENQEYGEILQVRFHTQLLQTKESR